MTKDIWVFAEHKEGKIKKVTFELLTKGCEMAIRSKGELAAVLVGHNVSNLVDELAYYGAKKVYVIDDSKLEDYTSDVYAKVISELIKTYQPATFLTGTTSIGRDFTPKLAVKLDAGIVSDVTDLNCDSEGKITVTRPIYAGKAFSKIKFECFPQIVVVRNNIIKPKEPDTSKLAEVINYSVNIEDSDIKFNLKEVKLSAGETIELTEADIICSAGRGLKNAENLYLINDLAKAMGNNAAVGASRAIVDAGWIDYSHQVGQTGKVVSPTLYVAVGISGAIQHLAGMSSSKIVAAINIDPDAPIFKVADYGIVGDAFKVIPALIEEIKKAKL